MRVLPPDLEMWLTDYVRAQADLEGRDIAVSNKEPAELSLPIARPLIVIRDDSGPRLDYTTFDRSIGASVLGWSKQNDSPANELARWLAAVLHDGNLPFVPGSPIASVEWGGCNGPYAVTENLDVARRYLTAQYVVAGSW